MLLFMPQINVIKYFFHKNKNSINKRDNVFKNLTLKEDTLILKS